MESVLRRTVVVGPEGKVEIPTTELAPGTTAEILVVFQEIRKDSDGKGGWSKHWAASDRLIANGMETWDLDRINAEIAERRGGDREAL